MGDNGALNIPYRTLYDGGRIPGIGFGTFGSDHAEPGLVAAAAAGALRCGYRLLDCASVYGNEDKIGAVLESAFTAGGVTGAAGGATGGAAVSDAGAAGCQAECGALSREDVFVMSKVWNDMHGRGDVLLSLAKTLKDLRLDYVDAFFVHWPFPNYHPPGCDGDTRNPDSQPFSADGFMSVWKQMERVSDMGLARYIGMSNMTVKKLDAVLPLCRVKPALIEMELHPAFQQPELFDYCVRRGIVPVGYCPLGSPNRPERDRTPEDADPMRMPEVLEIAAARGIHPAQVCLKWAARRGQIPIPFSVNEKNYASNLRCVAEDPLTDAEMAKIAAADKNCRLIKGQVFLWEGADRWEELWDE